MDGKSIANSTIMQVKPGIDMNALRISVLTAFFLSVTITVWSMLSKHIHILHIVHVLLISLTLLLIALYLHKSAKIASLMVFRELRQRLTVDKSAEFGMYLPTGSSIFNACVGALAKKDIYVRSSSSFIALARLKAIGIPGGAESRAGYNITKTTLADMGIALINGTDLCTVKFSLGEFNPTTAHDYDFILTQNRITHILAAVFISKVYVRFSLYLKILFISAVAATAALAAFSQFTYAAATIALFAAGEIFLVRKIEQRTARLTFQSVTRYK